MFTLSLFVRPELVEGTNKVLFNNLLIPVFVRLSIEIKSAPNNSMQGASHAPLILIGARDTPCMLIEAPIKIIPPVNRWRGPLDP
jgi:hypothetical protein